MLKSFGQHGCLQLNGPIGPLGTCELWIASRMAIAPPTGRMLSGTVSQFKGRRGGQIRGLEQHGPNETTYKVSRSVL